MTQMSTVPEATVPWLIQGGMGIAISGWPLARAVASAGQLGVVSGTAIDNVFVRRLQQDGVDAELQAVLDEFPLQSVLDEILSTFASRQRDAAEPFRTLPMLTHRSTVRSIDIVVLASYVEVALAKLGHDGDVGINLLTKVQIPTAATLCGAILAGVDYVVMGAGVPTNIPGVLQRLSDGEPVDLPLSVTGANSDNPATSLHFDPSRYVGSRSLSRPRFLGIVSSHVLANALAKRSNGPVDGFVLERPVAGGHNAPPRGDFGVDDDGNPEYGPRDVVDFEVLRNLKVPFWIGGGVTSREDVRDAMSLGASGVQVGTLFAYCDESGMDPVLRQEVLTTLSTTDVEIRTSLRASSTGYPFKVASVSGTISDAQVYDDRTRKCDLGYLREPYQKLDGSVSYRCAAEPVSAYVRKGGSLEATVDVTCLCNGLMATCGLGQVRSDGRREAALVTSGDRIGDVRQLLHGRNRYSASDVIAHLSVASLAPC
ncbi:MAG TPA: nitronate monooxygenase [Acidimicrobiales bacterium]|jgi:NAD(P)H-dependent flavin oxidoreductase YrpB (nitropropane dioxygenase family)|nr:nitronate monooxygenase [Acidimicrobiales bacterium]